MTSTTKQEEKYNFAYIGIASCGCIRAAIVDMPEHAKDVSKDVAGFIKDGLTVERVPSGDVGVRLCFEKHGKSNKECPHPQACPHREAHHA